MRPWPELFLYRIDTTLVILPSTAFIASGHMRFPTSRRLAIHGVIPAHLIADGVVRGVGICDARACVLFAPRTSSIVFNPSAGAITDHSQSANGIFPTKSPGSTRPVPTVESRYSFYEMPE